MIGEDHQEMAGIHPQLFWSLYCECLYRRGSYKDGINEKEGLVSS